MFQKYKDKMEQRLASHEIKLHNLQKTNIEIIQQNMKLLAKIDSVDWNVMANAEHLVADTI